MSEKLIFVLKEVYRLAFERSQAQRQSEEERRRGREDVEVQGVVDLADVQESEENKKKNQELLDFLYDLDFETIKIIQAVMLIGRGPAWGYKNEIDAYGKEEQVLKSYLNEVYWDTKWQAIDYITSKGPLHHYIEEGLRVLGVRITDSGKTKFSLDGKCPYCGTENVSGPYSGHVVSNNPDVKLTNYLFKCENEACGRYFRRNLE